MFRIEHCLLLRLRVSQQISDFFFFTEQRGAQSYVPLSQNISYRIYRKLYFNMLYILFKVTRKNKQY